MTGEIRIFTTKGGDLCTASKMDRVSKMDRAKIIGAAMSAVGIDFSDPLEAMAATLVACELMRGSSITRIDANEARKQMQEDPSGGAEP